MNYPNSANRIFYDSVPGDSCQNVASHISYDSLYVFKFDEDRIYLSYVVSVSLITYTLVEKQMVFSGQFSS